MMTHGRRRADEMSEVRDTLHGLGLSATMAGGAMAWQQAVGELRIAAPDGLDAKLRALLPRIVARSGIMPMYQNSTLMVP